MDKFTEMRDTLIEALDKAYELGVKHGIETARTVDARTLQDSALYAFIHDNIEPVGTGACGDVIWSIKLPAMSEEPCVTEFASSVRYAIAMQERSKQGSH